MQHGFLTGLHHPTLVLFKLPVGFLDKVQFFAQALDPLLVLFLDHVLLDLVNLLERIQKSAIERNGPKEMTRTSAKEYLVSNASMELESTDSICPGEDRMGFNPDLAPDDPEAPALAIGWFQVDVGDSLTKYQALCWNKLELLY